MYSLAERVKRNKLAKPRRMLDGIWEVGYPHSSEETGVMSKERRGVQIAARKTETSTTPRGGMKTQTSVERIANRARREPEAVHTALMHHFSEENLRACFQTLSNKKASGVDGVTKEEYSQNLEENLQRLHQKIQQRSYRPKPVRPVEIPKEDGTIRQLGISCTEDKIVQEMVRRILEAIYEPVFIESSYGFRPKRRCHNALRCLSNELMSQTRQLDSRLGSGSIFRHNAP